MRERTKKLHDSVTSRSEKSAHKQIREQNDEMTEETNRLDGSFFLIHPRYNCHMIECSEDGRKRYMIKRSFEHTTKYWNIIVMDDEFAVNYGKLGTIGKVQVKSFESNAECTNEVEKLIRQKLRKGYVESIFDWDNHIYVNDPEVGPSFLTSHPEYQAYFNDDFYVDCTEEYAPFGNDAGADALDMYEEVIRKDRDLCFLSYAYALIGSWVNRDVYAPEDWATYEYAYTCDQVVVAAAFASIKMTGKLTGDLKMAGIEAIHRLKQAFEKENQAIFEEVYERLYTFPTES